MVFTDEDADVLEKLAGIFCTDYYHVWTDTDFTECETCAGIKNSILIMSTTFVSRQC